ncbi:tyrosine-type recombinase/integrase [Roseibium aggregatum]|uniref:Tyrosine-type recombinase/integrase n=1 Tax=Roseibium aggregatum TaxID=187304 RepID=A0A939J7R5_9HYPH|nr:tyrosine-type recombinase/integrase [Roseibium aggregatum]MBN9674114.1 tyrosine-type recombinase/integrase [Roseibium aggregatum]
MKLRDAIEHYVKWRQVHGAKFVTTRNLLRQFLHHADGDAECDAVTKAQILAFLAGQGPVTRHRENKTYALAGFWRYAISRGYACLSPLPENEPRSSLRTPPHIYSDDQLQRLFDPWNIARALQGARQLDPATFRTLLLLLYGAGLRFGEATGLTRADVNLPDAVLTIRDTKFHKCRLVPVSPRLAMVLADHLSGPTSKRIAEDGTSFVLSNRDGSRLASSTVLAAFDRLRRVANVHGKAGIRELPRLHDLRHSFAVHRLTAWYREGADVQRLLPWLSTYLGHSDLEGTKAYLTMTPELLQQASQRFAHYVGGGANA